MELDCNAVGCQHNYKMNCLCGAGDEVAFNKNQIDTNGLAWHKPAITISAVGGCAEFKSRE